MPRDYVDVRSFGAVLDGKTDNTAANNRACSYCRANDLPLLITAAGGINLTGAVNRTGVSLFGPGVMQSKVQGLPGQDVFQWDDPEASSYIRPFGHYIKDMTIVIDDTVDVSSKFTRFGFAAERIGNCAIVYPVSRAVPPGTNIGEGQRFDVEIRSLTGKGNSCCGVYTQQPLIEQIGDYFLTQSLDFGWIEGPPGGRAVSFDAATNRVTQEAHGYPNRTMVAILSDDGVFTATPEGLLSSGTGPNGTYYFVRNSSGNTYQLSRTKDGPVVAFKTDGAHCAMAPAYHSTIEYAPDNINLGYVKISAQKVGISWCNWGAGAVEQLVIYPNAVCARFLNFPSYARYTGSQVALAQAGSEGPLDAMKMSGKEYIRIQWINSVIQGFALTGNKTHGASIGVYGSNNVLNFLGAGIGPGNFVNLYGNRNTITCYAQNEFDAINDYGSDNSKTFLDRSAGGGTTPFVSRRREMRDISITGGTEPDYLTTNPSSFYRNRRSMFVAGANLSPGSGVYLRSYRYDFNDSTSFVVGSVVLSYGIGKAQFSYWDGRNSAQSHMTVGELVPATKGTIYAMVKASAPCTATLTASTGSFSAATTTMALTPRWSLFACRYNAQAALGNAIGVVIGPASKPSDIHVNFLCFVPDEEMLAIDAGTLSLNAHNGYSGALHTGAGVIATDALSTGGGREQLLTIENRRAAQGDIVMLTRSGGTNSSGLPECIATTGDRTIRVLLKNNSPSAAFNGTFVYNFLLVKTS